MVFLMLPRVVLHSRSRPPARGSQGVFSAGDLQEEPGSSTKGTEDKEFGRAKDMEEKANTLGLWCFKTMRITAAVAARILHGLIESEG